MNATSGSSNQAFSAFMERLERDGLRPALAQLLERTDYRYIAIFRFRNGKASPSVYVDREHPDQLTAGEVPDTATYCCYVRDSRNAFTTADALRDERLNDHPARGVVAAYCGVPIMDAEGEIIGTLCHYDLVPRDPEQVDLFLMLQVASALAQGGYVPLYGSAAA